MKVIMTSIEAMLGQNEIELASERESECKCEWDIIKRARHWLRLFRTEFGVCNFFFLLRHKATHNCKKKKEKKQRWRQKKYSL